MIQIGKDETKVFLFADDMILCIKDFKASTRKLWLLINTFSKVAEYKLFCLFFEKQHTNLKHKIQKPS